MNEGHVFLIAVVAAALVVTATEFTRPHGARAFNRGVNGEKGLLFDPKSVPTTPPTTPPKTS
jgi:hypothetical protein